MRRISNRAVIVVRPKTPFVNWLRDTDVEGKDVTEEDIGKERNVYLVHDYEMDGDKDELIDENYKEIFEAELNARITDQTLWPRKMDLKTFLDWFHIEFHGMVLDLSEEGYIIE